MECLDNVLFGYVAGKLDRLGHKRILAKTEKSPCPATLQTALLRTDRNSTAGVRCRGTCSSFQTKWCPVHRSLLQVYLKFSVAAGLHRIETTDFG